MAQPLQPRQFQSPEDRAKREALIQARRSGGASYSESLGYDMSDDEYHDDERER